MLGFYLLMAKVEHVEVEKTKREKELVVLRAMQAPIEDIVDKKEEIEKSFKKTNRHH